MVVLDHFRNFKGIQLIVQYNIENERGGNTYPGKKGKLKTKKLLKFLGILDE